MGAEWNLHVKGQSTSEYELLRRTGHPGQVAFASMALVWALPGSIRPAAVAGKRTRSGLGRDPGKTVLLMRLHFPRREPDHTETL